MTTVTSILRRWDAIALTQLAERCAELADLAERAEWAERALEDAEHNAEVYRDLAFERAPQERLGLTPSGRIVRLARRRALRLNVIKRRARS